MDDLGSIAEPPTVPIEDAPRLSAAVRESVRRQIIALLEQRGAARSPDLIECPKCGERLILLDEPSTFTFDRDAGHRICAACGAERDLVQVIQPPADIGGEG